MKLFFVTDLHASATTPSSRKDNLMDALVDKLNFVKSLMSPEDWLLIGGDVYNSPSMNDYASNMLTASLPINVATIIGNHDMNRKHRYGFSSTSLAVLINSGRIRDLSKDPLKIGKFEIIGINYDQEISDIHTGKIVVAHKAIRSDSLIFTEEDYITPEDIQIYKPLMLLAGHEHTQFPISKIGDTYVIRPGSLTRGTCHTYNLIRDVFCSIIDIDNFSISYKKVPSKPSEDIFISDSAVVMKSLHELHQFIDSLESQSFVCSSLSQVLKSISLPEDVEALLREYLLNNNIPLGV